jgi:hypothetical protein
LSQSIGYIRLRGGVISVGALLGEQWVVVVIDSGQCNPGLYDFFEREGIRVIRRVSTPCPNNSLSLRFRSNEKSQLAYVNIHLLDMLLSSSYS